jgi:hypothetical protein
MIGRPGSIVSDLSNGICCFCGETIRGELAQDIELPYHDGSVQHLLAHGECLRSKLHTDIPYLTPQELQDDD